MSASSSGCITQGRGLGDEGSGSLGNIEQLNSKEGVLQILRGLSGSYEPSVN